MLLVVSCVLCVVSGAHSGQCFILPNGARMVTERSQLFRVHARIVPTVRAAEIAVAAVQVPRRSLRDVPPGASRPSAHRTVPRIVLQQRIVIAYARLY